MISLVKFWGRLNTSLISLFVLAAVFSFTANGAGEVDTSFGASVISGGSNVRKIIVQPDGKILASGSFRVVNGTARTSIARFNADGALDASFNPPDFFYLSVTPTIYDFKFQSNGKIIVVGDFFGINGVTRYRIVRLNADGSFDNSFAFVPLSATATDVVVYPDDKIVVGNQFGVTPLNSDGTPDTTKNFSGINFVSSMVLQSDGKLLVSYDIRTLKRYNADGSEDTTFPAITFDRFLYELELQPDGKILVGGSFDTVNGFAIRKIVRLNQNGTIDGTFSGNGTFGNEVVWGITVAPNGEIVITGIFGSYQGIARSRIALLNSDGTLGTSFNYQNHPFNNIYDTALQADGKILIGGASLLTETPLPRLNIDGTPDAAFQAKHTIHGVGHKVLIQPDGKIILGGNFFLANGTARRNLARFNADGSLDTSFSAPLFSFYSTVIYGIDLQPDLKVLIVGDFGSSSTDNRAARLNADGSTDLIFQQTSESRDIKLLPNGKILVSVPGQIKRFNSDGTPDGTFAATNGTVYKMVLQADGKILIGGSFSQVNGVNRGNFARLNSDGSLDTGFNTPGGTNAAVYEIAVQSSGKVIIAGEFTGVNFDLNRKYVARINTDGSLDTTFTPTFNYPVYAVKVQPNDRILIGSVDFVNLNDRTGVVRLNANGTLDSSLYFGIGSNGLIRDIELQTDGKIVFCGNFSQTNGLATIGVGRLLNTISPPTTLFDYDGDARADVSVFRPSENKWYIYRSSDGQITQQIFAASGDVAAPADYDGDGKTDMAIFRPSSGDWWYLSSMNGNQVFTHWGANGDIPRPSDFDGDGKADFIIFRPSENNWYRLGSTGTMSIGNFGSAGDKPVIGDFNGDGKSDVAIYRPSTGDWWWQSSADNVQRATHWGIASDIPAPADYDGDGKTDFAVYRPSEGVWYIFNSAGGHTIQNFGLAEDKPVPADYDGDGRADIAVYRPSQGTWYLLRTTAGFTAQQFGISTDIPTENAFVP